MKTKAPKRPAIPKEEQLRLVDEAIERLERLAESELEMARWFIQQGKPELGRKRLQTVLEVYGKSDSAKVAESMLKAIQ